MAKLWKYDIQELSKMYLDEYKSIKTISEILGVGYKAVRNALLREAIPLRKQSTKNLRHHSEYTKEKIRLSKIGNKNPQFGKRRSKEYRAKIGLAQLGRKHTASTKQRMSQTRIDRKLSVGDRNPMASEKAIKKWIKSNYIKPNKFERALFGIIETIAPGKFALNTKGEHLILACCIPDIVCIDGSNLLIEAWGDYWHRGDSEADRINKFKNLGYETLIIWEKELRNQPSLKIKIERFIENA